MGGKKEGGRVRWRRLCEEESMASWKGGGGKRKLGWVKGRRGGQLGQWAKSYEEKVQTSAGPKEIDPPSQQ
jgi:hypothetical protein